MLRHVIFVVVRQVRRSGATIEFTFWQVVLIRRTRRLRLPSLQTVAGGELVRPVR